MQYDWTLSKAIRMAQSIGDLWLLYAKLQLPQLQSYQKYLFLNGHIFRGRVNQAKTLMGWR